MFKSIYSLLIILAASSSANAAPTTYLCKGTATAENKALEVVSQEISIAEDQLEPSIQLSFRTSNLKFAIDAELFPLKPTSEIPFSGIHLRVSLEEFSEKGALINVHGDVDAQYGEKNPKVLSAGFESFNGQYAAHVICVQK